MTYEKLKKQAAELLKNIFKEEDFYFEIPLIDEYGDLSSTICFRLAKKYSTNPVELSRKVEAEIKNFLDRYDMIKDVKAINGYINFYANYENFADNVFKEIFSLGSKYGSSDLGKGKKVLIEHTNANPNKALHIGHARNACLGDSLARILKFVDYDVQVLNYVDDTGSQMADLLLGITKLGYSLDAGMKFDKYCGDVIYVNVNRAYEKNPQLLIERQKIIEEIDSQRGEIAKLSREIASKVLDAQIQTCINLGVYFDLINWESDIIRFDLLSEAIEKLKSLNIIKKEEEGVNKGCIVVRSEYIKGHEKETDKILIRSDGTSTYLAKDIAYAFWKLGLTKKKFKFKIRWSKPFLLYETDLNGEYIDRFGSSDIAISVIDARQSKLQDIIKSILFYIGGEDLQKRYLHYKYEVVALSNQSARLLGYEGKEKIVHMSSRKGLYFDVDDILDKLKEKIKYIVAKNNPNETEAWIEETSKKLAVSALRYALTKPDNNKIIVFDFDETLRLEGDSGVYVVYTYVRTRGIIRKASGIPLREQKGYNLNSEEVKIVKILAKFPEVVKTSATLLQPQHIALYLRELCDVFNSYYEKYPVLNSEEPARSFRLNLVKAISQTMENAMNLIGLIPLEKM